MAHARAAFGFLLLGALAACDPGQPPAATPARPAVALPPRPYAIEPEPASAERIRADITYLASPALGGRGTGEPGEREAAEFLATRFRALGLAPLGDGGTFLQGFRAAVGPKTKPPVLSWKGREAPQNPDEAWTAAGSASGEVSGQPVLVGRGISAPALGWDDYAKVDVKGKIAFVLMGAPTVTLKGTDDALRDYRSVRYKLRTAREHGAVAAVIVVGPADAMIEHVMDASSMGIPGVVMMGGYAERLLRARADKDAFAASGAPVKSRFEDPKLWASHDPQRPGPPLAPAPLTIRTTLEEVYAPSWNVVGVLAAKPGSPLAGETVVVGAHYDHLGHGGTPSSRAPGSHEVHAGADDNASGTALVLEVARRMKQLPHAPARNVVFIAFGAEELGILGSRYFVEHTPPAAKTVVAMINADMVGRLRGDKLVIDGAGTAKEWPALYEGAARGLDLKLAVGSEGFGASDHASFAAARVPVAFLFTGVHDDYHRPSDTADKVNARGEERVVTLAGRLALAAADAPARFRFVDAAVDPRASADPHADAGSMGRGFKVSLGTLPDYGFSGKGVKITGVRPDSPAARAGLAANDVIVKVGAHDIGNIHDYMFALGDLEAGREVVVVVLRDGKPVNLKVVPAPPR